MDKYQMFDALCKYNTNLQHVKSKIIGNKNNDTKCYNHINTNNSETSEIKEDQNE